MPILPKKKLGRPTKSMIKARRRAAKIMRERAEEDKAPGPGPGRRFGMDEHTASREDARRIAENMRIDKNPTPLDILTSHMEFYRERAAVMQITADGIDIEALPKTGAKRDKALKAKADAERAAQSYRNKAEVCAKEAAPFMHAKIQAVSITAKGRGPQLLALAGADADL